MQEDPAYAVLEVLARSGSDYVDRPGLANKAGVGFDDVPTTVEHLVRQGFPVEKHPAYGFRLPAAFDLIDRDVVNAELHRRGLNARVDGFVETPSTNDLAAVAEDEGTTIFAEHQTQGRGRLGRAWHSPVGTGLWFSTVTLLGLPVVEGWRITLGAGLAVAEAIEQLAGITPQLKWPNDVHINERKVAGVLTESKSAGGYLTHTVIGIGVNVHLDVSDFPPGLRESAGSVLSSGGEVRRGDLLVEILTHLDGCLSMSTNELRQRWSARCSHWGEDVRVEVDGKLVVGRAESLAENGAFVVKLPDGTYHAVHAGDVTRLRAVG